MFKRQSLGIYKFGLRIIHMKTEQGFLQVRVGGGYQKISDFVEMYYAVEKEKVDRAKMPQRKPFKS